MPTGSVTSGRGAGDELRVGGGECERTARRPALVWSAGILPGGSDGACQWLGTWRGPGGRCPALLFRRGTFPASPHRLACDQPSSCLLALVAANLALIGSGVCRPFGPSRACGAVPASAGAPRGPQGGSRGTCRLAKRPLLTEAIIEPRPGARRPGRSSDPCNRRRPHRAVDARHPPAPAGSPPLHAGQAKGTLDSRSATAKKQRVRVDVGVCVIR